MVQWWIKLQRKGHWKVIYPINKQYIHHLVLLLMILILTLISVMATGLWHSHSKSKCLPVFENRSGPVKYFPLLVGTYVFLVKIAGRNCKERVLLPGSAHTCLEDSCSVHCSSLIIFLAEPRVRHLMDSFPDTLEGKGISVQLQMAYFQPILPGCHLSDFKPCLFPVRSGFHSGNGGRASPWRLSLS